MCPASRLSIFHHISFYLFAVKDGERPKNDLNVFLDCNLIERNEVMCALEIMTKWYE